MGTLGKKWGPVLGVTALPASTPITRGNFSTKFWQKVRGKSGGIVQQKLRPPENKLLQIYLLGTREIVVRGVISRYPLWGRGAAAPNLTQICNVLATTV